MGLVVMKWDLSLKLMYTLPTVMGPNHPYLKNTVIWDGSLRRCNSTATLSSPYCEFEILFRQDIARALHIHDKEIDVTSVAASGLDSVIVSFRFIPLNETLFNAHGIESIIHMLIMHVSLDCIHSGIKTLVSID